MYVLKALFGHWGNFLKHHFPQDGGGKSSLCIQSTFSTTGALIPVMRLGVVTGCFFSVSVAGLEAQPTGPNAGTALGSWQELEEICPVLA